MERLDRGVENRGSELARPADPVVAPGDDAACHGVLREMRVGPFVDVVAEPVAPVLQELRRCPGVIDLVEVHLVRLGETEHPDAEDRRDEDDQQPEVEPVEPATGLVVETTRSIRSHRPLGELRPEPAP